MTKTLTEQWREGTLPDGYYYIDYDTQQKIFEIEDGCATYQGLPAETYFLNDVCLIKVLGPVPDYMDCKGLIYDSINLSDSRKRIDELVSKTDKLEKKLEIATKALNGIRDVWANNPSQFSYIARIANRKAKTALEEMEGVK